MVRKFFASLAEKYRAWKKKRYWKSIQIEQLRVMLESDARWMAHDPIVSALTERYLAMLRDDWPSVHFEHTSKLRDRLDLNPHSYHKQQ